MSYHADTNVRYIVVHYTASPVENDYGMADVDRDHRARGFREAGYHFLIRKDGRIETGRDLSQPGRFEEGAHAKGHNPASIGVCYEGGVRKAAPNTGLDTRTPAQKKAMIALLEDLTKRFPKAEVVGHRDMPYAQTQCPGFDAGAWWKEVRSDPARVRERVTKIEAQKAQPKTQGRAQEQGKLFLAARLASYAVFAGIAGNSLSAFDPATGEQILQVTSESAAQVIVGVVGFVGTFVASRMAKRKGLKT